MSEAAVVKQELDGEKLSTRNVSKLSTYALRQELVRREALDIPEEQINHNTMLKRLIEELVKDEAKATEERTEVVVDTAQQERDAAKALREKRKQEAIERSKARQAQKDYFEAKKGNNAVPTRGMDTGNNVGGDAGEDNEKTTDDEVDPFRIGPSRRSKVHVT